METRKLRVFEVFAGYGSQTLSLDEYELAGTSEVDIDTIVS